MTNVPPGATGATGATGASDADNLGLAIFYHYCNEQHTAVTAGIPDTEGALRTTYVIYGDPYLQRHIIYYLTSWRASSAKKKTEKTKQ